MESPKVKDEWKEDFELGLLDQERGKKYQNVKSATVVIQLHLG